MKRERRQRRRIRTWSERVNRKSWSTAGTSSWSGPSPSFRRPLVVRPGPPPAPAAAAVADDGLERTARTARRSGCLSRAPRCARAVLAVHPRPPPSSPFGAGHPCYYRHSCRRWLHSRLDAPARTEHSAICRTAAGVLHPCSMAGCPHALGMVVPNPSISQTPTPGLAHGLFRT